TIVCGNLGGACPSGEHCGGGGFSRCGTNNGTDGGITCTPRTCQQAGASCGPVGDGCGTLIASCGPDCTAPQTCGGGGTPSVCGGAGSSGGPDLGGPCTNLCLHQTACSAGVTTSFKGTVVAATRPDRFGDPDPIYNATVYVPNGTVQPFGPKV